MKLILLIALVLASFTPLHAAEPFPGLDASLLDPATFAERIGTAPESLVQGDAETVRLGPKAVVWCKQAKPHWKGRPEDENLQPDKHATFLWMDLNATAKKIRPNWDSHEDLVRDHGYWGAVLDTGASALLKDLKRQGMLDDTLVICTTEFGRQPGAQGGEGKGRDHNAGAFTAWLAGGGIRGGVGYGATDELGFKAVESPTYSYDLHATALHLRGIDHTRLTFYNNGIDRRLTDVHGHVIREILT